MGEQIARAGDGPDRAPAAEVAVSPVLALAARIAGSHHERWDGTGYPRGLSGEAIPLEGRIVAVADVFDALSNARPYKPAFPLTQCLAILDEGRGTQFDPAVLDAFQARLDEILAVRRDLAD
jgi:putative two-component system response regulator